MRSALAGHAERVKREQLTHLEISWHNARWASFSQKLESLSEVLRQAKGGEQDPDAAWHQMKIWAAAYGQAIEED